MTKKDTDQENFKIEISENVYVTAVKKMKLLGVVIENTLRWDEYIKMLINQLLGRLVMLRKILYFSNIKTRKAVASGLIIGKLL